MAKTFGERIKKLREKSGKSGEAIARELAGFGIKISTQTYYNWENDHGGPNPMQFNSLASVFGVEVQDLV